MTVGWVVHVCPWLCAMSAAALAQQGTPATPATAASPPTPPPMVLRADDRAPRNVDQIRLTDPSLLFGGWRVEGTTVRTDARGLRIDDLDASATPIGPALSPSLASLGPTWAFDVRATRNGPAGLRFTARAGATSGGRVPAFASDLMDGPPSTGVVFRGLDPSFRQVLGSAGLGVERDFRLGAIDVTLFGEALVVGGLRPGRSRTRESTTVADPFHIPVRLSTGVRMKF